MQLGARSMGSRIAGNLEACAGAVTGCSSFSLSGSSGVVAGALGGFALARVVGSYIQNVQLPGVLPVVGSAAVLLVAAVIGSLLPAARAARVDVVQALRAE